VKVLSIISKAILIFIAAIFLFLSIFNLNWLKGSIEKTLNEQTGLDIQIGEINYRLISLGHFELRDLKVQASPDLNTKLAFDQLMIEIEILPLLSSQKDIVINQISLAKPRVVLWQDEIEAIKAIIRTDKSSTPKSSQIESSNTASQPIKIGVFTLKKFDISDLSIEVKSSNDEQLYLQDFDLNLDIKTTINSFHNQLNPQKLIANTLSELTIEISQVAIGVNQQNHNINELKFKNQLKDLVADFSIIIDDLLTGNLNTSGKYELSPRKLSLVISELNLELEELSKLQAIFSQEQSNALTAKGKLSSNGNVYLSLVDLTPEALKRTTSAQLSLVSDQLHVEGLDLDKAINGFKDSQQVSLLDVGGFLLAGPVGILASQLTELSSGGLLTSGGQTDITGLQVQTTLSNGLLNLDGTALATKENFIGLKGNVDLADESFKDFKFALLNPQGCADIEQTLNGPVKQPQSAVTNTLLGTVINPLKQAASAITDTVTGKECEIFYQGLVQYP